MIATCSVTCPPTCGAIFLTISLAGQKAARSRANKEEKPSLYSNMDPLLREEGYQGLFASCFSLSKKSLSGLDFSDEFKKILWSQVTSFSLRRPDVSAPKPENRILKI
jgi:hypothetical protein